MAVSQNGWDLVTIGEIDRTVIPGTNIVPVPGVLRGDVATILHWVGTQFNSKVEKLYNPGCWGWNPPTPIPGTNIYSNHSSGTAVDFNAPSFPWKLYTMTPAQRQACREIAAQTEGVVVWGGDFPTFVDEMHFEIDATDAEVARIANKLKGEDMSKMDFALALKEAEAQWGWDKRSDERDMILKRDIVGRETNEAVDFMYRHNWGITWRDYRNNLNIFWRDWHDKIAKGEPINDPDYTEAVKKLEELEALIKK